MANQEDQPRRFFRIDDHADSRLLGGHVLVLEPERDDGRVLVERGRIRCLVPASDLTLTPPATESD
jgi:hypothetical protein